VPKTGSRSLVELYRAETRNRLEDRTIIGIFDDIKDRSINDHHMKISEVEPLLDIENYFKFAFVRNPWDRLVSEYFYRTNRIKFYTAKTFEGFVLQLEDLINGKVSWPYARQKKLKGEDKHLWLNDLKRHLCPQKSFIVNKNGKTAVDFIGRFENYADDCRMLREKFGFSNNLPHANKSKHSHYTNYYNARTRDIVSKVYKEDIEYFGYEYA